MKRPDENILDRGLSRDMQQFTAEITPILEECVNYQTVILKQCIDAGQNENVDFATILLFRHITEQLDAITVLFKECCYEPTQALLRSSLEAFFSLEYILKADTERRCLAYRISTIYQKLDWANQGDLLPNFHKEQYVDNYRTALKNPRFSGIFEEWERIKLGRPETNTQKKIRPKKPKWYSLFGGPNNIAELAKNIGREQWYIMYKSWSQGIHASNPTKHITGTEDGYSAIAGLRDPQSINQVLTYFFILFFYPSLAMINYYVPGRKSNFINWYYQTAKPLHDMATGNHIKIVFTE